MYKCFGGLGGGKKHSWESMQIWKWGGAEPYTRGSGEGEGLYKAALASYIGGDSKSVGPICIKPQIGCESLSAQTWVFYELEQR